MSACGGDRGMTAFGESVSTANIEKGRGAVSAPRPLIYRSSPGQSDRQALFALPPCALEVQRVRECRQPAAQEVTVAEVQQDDVRTLADARAFYIAWIAAV